MIVAILTISTLAALFGGAATFAASGSVLLSIAAYSGTGFMALTCVLLIALFREHLFTTGEDDAVLFPAGDVSSV